MEPCQYCGAQGRSCYPGCVCSKCVDPIGYEMWKTQHPEEYDAWLCSQMDANEWTRYMVRVYGLEEDEEPNY